VELEDDRPEVEQERLADSLLAVQASAQARALDRARAPGVIRVSLSESLQRGAL
jgi:hypothetical protein